jgi:large subunit ribosomal protein L1
LGHSKRYNSNFEKINRDKEYSLEEAAELLSSFSHPKFDESVELAINLGVDPKHADQIVRGTVALPNGIGKDIKVSYTIFSNNFLKRAYSYEITHLI